MSPLEIGNDRQNALRLESLPFPMTFKEGQGFTRLAPDARCLEDSLSGGRPELVIQGDDPAAAVRLAVGDGQGIVRRMCEACFDRGEQNPASGFFPEPTHSKAGKTRRSNSPRGRRSRRRWPYLPSWCRRLRPGHSLPVELKIGVADSHAGLSRGNCPITGRAKDRADGSASITAEMPATRADSTAAPVPSRAAIIPTKLNPRRRPASRSGFRACWCAESSGSALRPIPPPGS